MPLVDMFPQWTFGQSPVQPGPTSLAPSSPVGMLNAPTAPVAQPEAPLGMLSPQPVAEQGGGFAASPFMQNVSAVADSGFMQDLSYGLLNGKNWGQAANLAGNRSLEMAPQRRKEAKAEEQLNKTRQLIEQKYPELVPYLDAGQSPNDVLQIALARDNEVQTSQMETARRSQLAGFISDPAAKAAYLAGELDFESARAGMGVGGTSDWSKLNDGTLFNQRTGETMPVEGYKPDQPTPPSGYQWAPDGTSLMPIPNGPNDPAVRRPPSMSPTIQKEIFATDEAIQAGQSAIGSLNRALELSKTALDGPLANAAGVGALFGDQSSQDTQLLQNEVTSQALSQMKVIFGAAPTEGERKILLEIQGAANLTKPVRDEIYRRGLEMANRRLAANQQKAEGLRSGEYFGADYGAAPANGSSGVVPEGMDAGDWEMLTTEERALW